MEPITLMQSRTKMVLVAFGCLAFVGISALMIADPDGTSRYGPEAARALGLAAGALFGGWGLLAAAQVARPARLFVEPGGLTYEWLWRRRFWSWREVGEFEVERVSSSRMIRFAATGVRETIPGGWRLRIEDVCARLNAARDRWG